MFRPSYVAAVQALDAYSQSKYRADFAALSPAQQDAILTDMDLNRATGFVPNAKAVFEMIRTHTLEGMFGDPSYGGNANFAGWDLIGYPGPRMFVSAEMQKMDATMKFRAMTVYPLDGCGKRMTPLAKGESVRLNAETPWYELVK